MVLVLLVLPLKLDWQVVVDIFTNWRETEVFVWLWYRTHHSRNILLWDRAYHLIYWHWTNIYRCWESILNLDRWRPIRQVFSSTANHTLSRLFKSLLENLVLFLLNRSHCICLFVPLYRRSSRLWDTCSWPLYICWVHSITFNPKINMMIYNWTVKIYIIINIGYLLWLILTVLKLHNESQGLGEEKLFNWLLLALSDWLLGNLFRRSLAFESLRFFIRAVYEIMVEPWWWTPNFGVAIFLEELLWGWLEGLDRSWWVKIRVEIWVVA